MSPLVVRAYSSPARWRVIDDYGVEILSGGDVRWTTSSQFWISSNPQETNTSKLFSSNIGSPRKHTVTLEDKMGEAPGEWEFDYPYWDWDLHYISPPGPPHYASGNLCWIRVRTGDYYAHGDKNYDRQNQLGRIGGGSSNVWFTFDDINPIY